MAALKQLTREERLMLLKRRQEELAKIKVGSDQSVLKLQSGITTVRILPAVGNMDPLFYHQAVGYHMLGNTVVRCSEFTTSFEIKCPFCEVIEVLRRGSPNDKNLAGKIRLNKKYWMNVIVRSKDGDLFNTADGPFILKAGVMIFDRTRSLTSDPDYGFIDDPEQGVDLKIEKTGDGRDTRYEVNPRKGDYQPLLATNEGKVDWDACNALLEKVKDLSVVTMPDDPKEDAAFLENLGYDPYVKVYGYERTILQYGVCLETIGELPAIIEANAQGQGDSDEGEEGGHATPARASTNKPSTKPEPVTSDDIKARIARLRGNSS
jgi:hypothetical protein